MAGAVKEDYRCVVEFSVSKVAKRLLKVCATWCGGVVGVARLMTGGARDY